AAAFSGSVATRLDTMTSRLNASPPACLAEARGWLAPGPIASLCDHPPARWDSMFITMRALRAFPADGRVRASRRRRDERGGRDPAHGQPIPQEAQRNPGEVERLGTPWS